jgi:hypothetical protein
MAEGQRDAGRLRRPVGPPPVEVLYVWAISRLARNTRDGAAIRCLKLLAALDEGGIRVISLTEPDVEDRSVQRLLRPILAWLAERYSEELSRNVQRGMRSQAEKGQWVFGRPPYGYATEPLPGTEGSYLVVTDATRPAFEIVQRIFREYLDGQDGEKRLAERLTREGVAPPSWEGRPARRVGAWRSQHVHRILVNPAYTGDLVYRGEVVARGTHEAAADGETFRRVQAKRRLRAEARQAGEGNGASPLRIGEQGLLTPWLRCGQCGGRVHVAAGGRPGKRTFLYYCATRSDNRAACAGISVRTERLDAIVLDALERDVLTEENLRALAEDTLDRLGGMAADEAVAERAAMKQEAAELDREIQRTGALVLSGVLGEADAKALNAPRIARRDHLRLRLAALPSRVELPRPDEIDPERFRAAVKRAWDARPVEERRAALDGLLDSITLSPGGVHISYRAKPAAWGGAGWAAGGSGGRPGQPPGGDPGYHGHAPYGPPYGSWVQYEVRLATSEVRLPRSRVTTRSTAVRGSRTDGIAEATTTR